MSTQVGMVFKNREDAGWQLARELAKYTGRQDVIVLGVPRGGVEVAFPIAQALGVTLDVFLSRKLGVPGEEELAFGAVAADGTQYLNDRIIAMLGITAQEREEIAAKALKALRDREAEYRAGRGSLDVAGKVAILVDDGIATGASMEAAVRMLKKMQPERIVVAVPVGALEACARLRKEADEVVCLVEERDFSAVGQFYRDFSPVSNGEALELLKCAKDLAAIHAGADPSVLGSSHGGDLPEMANGDSGLVTGEDADVVVRMDGLKMAGILHIPADCKGVVLFAHGSGSSRFSPRNRYVAKVLQRRKIGTLLFDLLTKEEEREDEWSSQIRFDIPLLAERMAGATKWLEEYLGDRKLPFGYFGASTGAAAALVAAAKMPEKIAALVSRGGRPDLAGDALERVTTPTLLLVGGLDGRVVGMNEEAFKRLKCTKKLQVIPGASHLFEEPGTLEAVVEAAAAWFRRNLGGAGAR